MALTQKYGIMYPFKSDNLDGLFLDLNTTNNDCIKSKVLHTLFTSKGQKIRDPEFGTDLIKYLFDPLDDTTLDALKEAISSDIKRQVPEVQFRDISINNDEQDEHSRIIIVHYVTKENGENKLNSVAVKL